MEQNPNMSTKAIPSSRQLKWHGTDIYAIIHFSMNTFTDREWGYGDESPSIFNPSAFDPDQIAGTLKEAGFNGLIFVCKHHDGFCLWPTKTTEHNISKSPWKNGQGDMVKEFADATRKAGMKFGAYLSPWDRNHPEYGKAGYVKVYHKQLEELLTNYGELFEVWFDGANGGDGYYGGAREKRSINASVYYEWDKVHALVRKHQPDACIFSDVGPELRWVGNEDGIAAENSFATFTPRPRFGDAEAAPGNAITSESGCGHPGGKCWMPAECDVPLRPGWFYHPAEDNAVKSPEQLLDIYMKSVGRGGALNLGIAPDRRGIIHENDRLILLEWKKKMDRIFTMKISEKESDFKLSLSGKINLISIKEDIRYGQNVRKFDLILHNADSEKILYSGQSIGAARFIKINPIAASYLELRVIESEGDVKLKDFSAWYTDELEYISAPEIHRSNDAFVSLTHNDSTLTLRYTIDGSIPDRHSEIYRAPFPFKKGGIIKAKAFSETSSSSTVQSEFDYSQERWLLPDNASVQISQIPIVQNYDMGEILVVESFTFTPTGGHDLSIPARFNIYIEDDMQALIGGEFSNIAANRIRQRIALAHPVKCRKFRFEILSAAGHSAWLSPGRIGVKTV